MAKYERDFEVGDMIVVTSVEKSSILDGETYNLGDLGFVKSLDEKCGVAIVYFDTSKPDVESFALYEEIEKFNSKKEYK